MMEKRGVTEIVYVTSMQALCGTVKLIKVEHHLSVATISLVSTQSKALPYKIPYLSFVSYGDVPSKGHCRIEASKTESEEPKPR